MKSEMNIIEEIMDADFKLTEGNCRLSNRDEVIDQYVTNELSEDAINAFDEHCLNCDVCFQALRNRERFVQLIKSEGRTIFADIIEERRPASSLQSLLDKLLSPGSIAPAKWAFAAVVMFAIVGGSYWMLRESQQNDFLASIHFDDRVPYAFESPFGSSLRRPSEAREDDVELDRFYDRFLAAIAAYRSLNYSRANEILEPLRPCAERLLTHAANDTVIAIVRDYYFYFGVSHLALAQSQRVQLNEAARQHHLETAIGLLERSVTLAVQQDFNDNSRDHYFLGLAYGLSGKEDNARRQLEKMKPGSQFFGDSQKLLDQWAQ